MTTDSSPDIFQPMKFGKETFLPLSYDEQSFVMQWTLEKGGMVPPHTHEYMDETFLITEGEVTFKVGSEKFVRGKGDSLTVPKGVTHSISNKSGAPIGITVTYSPCSDTHRMFAIIQSLNQEKPGSMMNMIKYFYLAPRLGLKPFSSPQPKAIGSIINGITSLAGALWGWKKYINRFKNY